MDQRSGDGWFSGWYKVFVINKRYFNCRILKFSMRGLLQHWTESSIILISKEESVWRNKRPRSRTVSFAEDRLLTWSMNTSGSPEPTILSWTTPTCSLLFFEMTIFRNSIQSGTEFYVNDENPTRWNLLQIKNTRVWETQDRIGIVWLGDSSEEIRTWLSQIENDGEKKYRAKTYEIRILAPRMEIMKETPWSRIQRQNSVYKEFLEIVGNGSPTGSVLEETIAVSATILISVEKWHSRIRLRILSCSRVKEKHREPEVPEERKSPSGRMSRWPCKHYLKGMCTN